MAGGHLWNLQELNLGGRSTHAFPAELPWGGRFRFLPISHLTLTTDISLFSHSFIQNYANASEASSSCECRQVWGCVHSTLPRGACVCPRFSRSGWDSVNAGREEVQGPPGRRDNSVEWSWAGEGSGRWVLPDPAATGHTPSTARVHAQRSCSRRFGNRPCDPSTKQVTGKCQSSQI